MNDSSPLSPSASTSKPVSGSRVSKRIAAVGFVPVLALASLVALFWLMGALPSQAAPAATVYYVTESGSGTVCSQGTPCALQTAVNLAIDGDEVRVAEGTYTSGSSPVLYITQSITITGGYDAAAWSAAPDPQNNETILDGGSTVRVVEIDGPVSPMIRYFTIRNGSATNGGGIYDTGFATIEDNKIYQNQAVRGGGIYVINGGSSQTIIRFNQIYSNTATGTAIGGGIFLFDNSAAFIEGNTIYGNTAGTGGGLAAFPNVTSILQNNLFYRNQATDSAIDRGGGAIFLLGTSQVWNNTIVGNTAPNHGAGVFVGSDQSPQVQISNTIVASNTGGITANDGIHNDGGTVTGGYNNIYQDNTNVSLSNPVAGDPQFTNLAAFNLHLQGTSPNVDAGDPNTAASVSVDIDGQARPFNGTVDVGADEYYPNFPNFDFSAIGTYDFVDRGTAVTYNYRLENTGTVADTYTFICANDQWSVDSCPTDTTLDPGDIANVSAQVTVPGSATALTVGTTMVTATSTVSSTLAQVVIIESTVAPLPDVTFTPSYSQTLLPGAVVTFTHRLTNTGDAPDTFNLIVTQDPLGWAELLPSDPLTVPLGAGASQDILVRVQVPAFAAEGYGNTAVIEAASGFDPTVSDSVTDTVTAEATVGTRHVRTGGSDLNNNCTQPGQPCATVARGIDQASGTDEVRIATGQYTEADTPISINGNFLISGGWNTNFTSQDGAPSNTEIQAEAGRIFNIVGTQPTIGNLTLHDSGGGGIPGGAVFASNYARPQLSKIIFRGNQGSNGGAVYVTSNAWADIVQSRFITNTAQAGGAVYVAGTAGQVDLENNLFDRNTATSGNAGALYAGGNTAGNTTRVLHNTFIGNDATGNGGALYNNNATLDIVNSILVSNTATSGSAVYQNGGTTTMNTNLLWNNSVSGVSSETGTVNAAPLFADNEYRLSLDSPALDYDTVGNTNLVVDFEDDFRPSDQGYDLGYDERPGCRAKRDDTIYGSIQAAVDANASSDLILVTGVCRGVHTLDVGGSIISQTVHLTQSLTIQGGWNGNFSDRTGEPTYVDAEGNGRGFYLSQNVAPTLEGLTIINGDATGLGGGPAGEDAGGGIYNLDSNVTLRQIAIYTSTADLGGGFYNHTGTPTILTLLPDEDPDDPPPPLSEIAANTANQGGGLYNYNGTLTVDSTLIHDNAATDGGGLYNRQGVLDAANTVIYENAASNGGGLYNEAPAASLLHLTVYSNTASANGGGLYNAAGNPMVHSNIFQSNQATSGAAVFVVGGTPDLDYNYYHDQGNNPVSGASPGANAIVDNVNPPGLIDPAAGDFHLEDNAAAVDVGDPASPVTSDFDNDIRPSNQGPDMGADEIVGCLARVNDVIYGNIQVALENANPGDQIDVAGRCSGVHSYDAGGSLGTILQTVHVTKNVVLLGGWNTNFSARNDVTILDAENKGLVIYVAPGITTTIDSFDIIQGDGSSAGTGGNGGAIYIDNASPSLRNNRIYSNTAGNGGAIYSIDGAPVIEAGNRIYANQATNDGGAVYLSGTSAAVTQNNFVYDNTAGNGGAFLNAGGDNTFWHNTLVNNMADFGGGIYVANGAPDIRNNILLNNTATDTGGLYVAGGSPTLNYNDYFGNVGGNISGASDPNALNVDPAFTTPAFTLTIGSPVVDQGDPGMSLLVDFEDDIRPSHQGFDIGADEVGGCFARVLSDPNTIYGSVQQAIDVAPADDTVQVDGTCYGVNQQTGPVLQTAFINKSITLDGDWAYQSAMTATLDALGNGRVLYVTNGNTVTVTNITLRNGDGAPAGLSGNGGGVYNDGTLALVDLDVQGNTAAQGGGVYNDGDLTMRGARIDGNSATSGGGLYQNGGALFADGNKFYQNDATNGGAIALGGGSVAPEVRNNFIYENSASTNGGGLYNAGTGANVWHNTVVGNSDDGIYNASGSPDIRNNIVDSNSGIGINIGGGTPANLSYNNVVGNSGGNYAGASAGTGAISQAPDYVSAATDDYHLQDGSAGVDVGDLAISQTVPIDYDGHVRPTNGGSDMGADEINSCLIRVINPNTGEGEIFGVLQDAVDTAVSYGAPFPDVEIARGECTGIKSGPGGTLQVGYVPQSLNFIGSLRRSDFSDPNDYYNDEVNSVSSIINAEGQGRVIYVGAGANPTFQGLAFVGGDAFQANDSNSNGGGIYNGGANAAGPQFQESFICENRAQNGAGYYAGAPSNADFTGMRIGYCYPAQVTENDAGGVESVSYIFFDGNEATSNGGGIYSAGGFDVRNVAFYDNVAGSNGGAVYNTGSQNRLINATIYSNTAQIGGGVYNNGSQFAMYHNTVRNNSATGGNGGGIYNLNASFVLNSSLVYTNTATATGGGLFTNGGSTTYNNFYDNSPDHSNASVLTDPDSFSADPRLLGVRTLSPFSPNIDEADPDLWNVGVPPDNLIIDYDTQLDFRPDGHNNPNYTGLYGYDSDIGADEYFKDFGCAVEPASQTGTAVPGQTVTYIFSIVNVGNPPLPDLESHGYTDTIDITLDSQLQGWSILQGGPSQSVELGWGEFVQRAVTVTVPTTATLGMQEQTVIRCRSQSIPTRTDTGTATTNVGEITGVEIGPPYLATATPGTVLTYTHTITNHGNLADTFRVTPSPGPRHATASLIDGGSPVDAITVTIGAGETTTVSLRIRILDTAAAGEDATPGAVVESTTRSEVFDAVQNTILIDFIASTRYVATNGGSDNLNNCTDPQSPCATIQRAINQATAEDTVLVASGTYTDHVTRTVVAELEDQNVFIDKSITIKGGYDAADEFTTAEPITNAVILSGEGARRVIYVADSITATLQSLFIQDGFAPDTSINERQPGGGIYNAGANLTISGTWVLSNSARTGGGLYHSNGPLTVNNSVFADNDNDNPGNEVGEGGGLYVADGSALLQNNTFASNQVYESESGNCVGGVSGNGAAIYQARGTATVSNTIFTANTGCDDGATFYISTTVTLDEGYNLFFANQSQLVGSTTNFITNTTDLTGDPRFSDQSYHIAADSAAKDTGTSNITIIDGVDFDLAPRKQGIEVDIGADERTQIAGFVFRPLTQTAIITQSERYTYTHAITNTGDFTDTYSLAMLNQEVPPVGDWAFELRPPSPISDLAPGDSVTVTLIVTGSALGGAQNTTVITATSASDLVRTVTDTTRITQTAAVDIEPSRSGNGVPGQLISYTHTLTNTGDGVDEFTIQPITTTADPPTWTVTVTPTQTGFLQPNDSIPFTVTVAVPANALSGTVHTVEIEAVATDPAARDVLTDTTTVPAFYGLTLTPDNARTVPDDTTVVYTHTLTSLANTSDTFTLTVSSNPDWPVAVEPLSVTLPAFASQPVSVTVTVPVGTGGLVHTATVTATSSTGLQATAVNTTTVDILRGVLIEPDHFRVVDDDTVVTYTHTVTNTSNVTDTFDVTAASSQGWLTGFSGGSLQLGPGVTGTVMVTVTVPLGASPGAQDTTVITATSQISPTVFDTATDVTLVTDPSANLGVIIEPDNAGVGQPGDAVQYHHTVTNTGTITDAYTLSTVSGQGWATSVTPASVLLGPSQSGPVTVTVQIPPAATMGVQDTTTVTVASQTSLTVTDAATDTTLVTDLVPDNRGVDIEPSNADSGQPGQILLYQHTVTNTGTITDAYILSASSSQGWNTTIMPVGTILAPGQTQSVLVTVEIPAGATPGTQDQTAVKVTSQAVVTVTDTATDTTTVVAPPAAYAVVIEPDNSSTSPPGQTIQYQHVVTNTGTNADSYTLGASSSQGWTASVSPPTLSLAAGASQPVTVSVTIPAGVPSGTIDVTTVTVTSDTDGAVSDTAIDTTTVTAAPSPYGVLIEPDNSDTGQPRDTILYQHTVTNTGSIPDIINLSVSSSQGWVVSVNPTATARLNPGQSQQVQVAVDIPTGATDGMVDITTVTATSSADAAVSDSATDTTRVTVAPPPPPSFAIYLPIIHKAGGEPPPPPPPSTPTPTPTPCTPTGVDLIVSQIRVEPNPPAGGQQATVYVTIMNQGSTDVRYGNNFYLDFYVDRLPQPLLIGDIVWGIQGVDLASGASQTYSAPYTFSSGSHQLWAQVDTDNTVDECPFEDNNILGRPLSVTGLREGTDVSTPEREVAPGSQPRHTPTPPPVLEVTPDLLPADTVTPTAEATATATLAVTPTPTLTPTASPSATPTPSEP